MKTTAKPLAMTFAQANYERRLAQLEGRLPYRKKSSANLTTSQGRTSGPDGI